MPALFFSIVTGSTPGNLINVETYVRRPPSTFPDQVVANRGRVRVRTLDKKVHRYGEVAPIRWRFDVSNFEEKGELEEALFGTTYPPTSDSVAVVVSTFDTDGYYSPYTAIAERPYPGEGFRSLGSGAITFDLVLHDLTLLTTTKSTNVTINADERLVLVDTSGGNRTITLPNANGPQPYTPFSFVKQSASNTLTIDGAGSETIDGATTATLTALNQRIDIYSDGTAWRTIRRLR